MGCAQSRSAPFAVLLYNRMDHLPGSVSATGSAVGLASGLIYPLFPLSSGLPAGIRGTRTSRTDFPDSMLGVA